MIDRRLDSRRRRVLLAKELRDLARDRKVLYAAILLPALLFPLLIGFSGKLFKSAEKKVTAEVVRVGLSGQSSNLDQLVALVQDATWARAGTEDQIRSADLDAVVTVDRSTGTERYSLLYDASRSTSCLARERLAEALDTVLVQERGRMLEAAGSGETSLPARNIDVVDLAPFKGAGSSQIPRLLPMLLVLILLSASAFAAIDLFPGERERGTLETLLVQPMTAAEVLIAKYAAVCCVGVAAIIANLVGMLAASALRTGAGQTGPALSSLLWLFVISLPLTLFLAAFLVRVVARARSVREAQNYLLPLTLLCLLPPLVAGSPDVPFDVFTACMPLAGPALAFREISVGNFPLAPLLAMVVATLACTVVVLAGTLKHLSNEEHLLRESGSQPGRSGRAVMIVLCSILALYVAGPFFGDHSPFVALGVPLVLFAGLPPLLFGRWAGMAAGRLLAFRMPTPRCLTVALSAGLGLAMLSTSIGSLQKKLLPPPKALHDAAAGLLGTEPVSLLGLLLLLAVLPAVIEELLYRRFLLQSLLRSTDTTKAIVITAVLFGLHHLSVFRFLPAFTAGVVLGWLVVTTHSFWTAPIAHAVSNGLLVLAMLEHGPLHGTPFGVFLTAEPWALIRIPAGVALILVPKWVLYHRSQWGPAGRLAA